MDNGAFKITVDIVDLKKHLVNGALLTDIRFNNPVPVYSGKELIGAANLKLGKSTVSANAFLRKDHPDRLSFEVGEKIYLRLSDVDFFDPYLANGYPRFAAINIKSLEVSSTPVDPDLSEAIIGDFEV